MADNTDTTTGASSFTLAMVIAGIEAALAFFGLNWSSETVNTEPDKTGSVKVVASDDAQILSIVDYDNFTANFPNAKEILLGIANGTVSATTPVSARSTGGGAPSLIRPAQLPEWK